MLINERSKRSIAFRPDDAKRVGEGCFYLDQIVWLNGDRIELGDRVGFNYGCYVNGYSGLVIGDDVSFGPYTMIHTADHETSDADRPIREQGWKESPPVRIGRDCWVGMGVCILAGVQIGAARPARRPARRPGHRQRRALRPAAPPPPGVPAAPRRAGRHAGGRPALPRGAEPAHPSLPRPGVA